MDKRSIVAIVLCFFIFLGWQKLYLEPRVQGQKTNKTSNSEITKDEGVKTVPESSHAIAKQVQMKNLEPVQKVEMNLHSSALVLGSGASFLEAWHLNDYTLDKTQKDLKVDLLSVTNQVSNLMFDVDLAEFANLSQVRGKFKKTEQGASLWTYEDDRIKMSRTIEEVEGAPYLNVRLKATFKKARPNFAYLSLFSKSLTDNREEVDRVLAYYTANKIERVEVRDIEENQMVNTGVKWIAAANRYFTLAVVPQEGIIPRALIQPAGEHAGRASLVFPVSSSEIEIPFRIYFGPKDLHQLRMVAPSLDSLVDFGWFTFLAYPLLSGLKWLYSFLHNYGLAIILLTIFLKLLTFPLNYKSMKSMKRMSALQPKLAALKEKYADDKEALNREMMVLMRTEGYNPVAGCLPMLLQIPVFFALYRVLYSSVELYQAPFMGWLQDLSVADPFYITPVVLTLTMWVQQKLTPNTATDPAQQKMLQLMPLIFGAFMITLPSGLTVYMLTNMIVSILQQLFLNKKLGGSEKSALKPAQGT
ncbi:MAG: hypothetical protein CL678_12555 [Bdellovibrionaceae bacterium]|nr:hypothetical protein [Pseudobdellovibrionaceae bacterium]|tara:strand:+ start:969 stop:2558 length:1590 start_codon:yes stop_codon:yes gene_type:complete